MPEPVGMVGLDADLFADGLDALPPGIRCRVRMDGFAAKEKVAARRGELFEEFQQTVWDEDGYRSP